ncbi:Short-chain dehydrogenase/reductase SDR [Modestobacter italicus]|uniref:Short-chain dehydrogenase/reductase SDR n=1 Tax=Modestobacter italicus (strain DSM 44449 / CECT 9708 / BC 501) TaxID=2732864 RepID=I4EUF2_MODI5|nr:SDR family oxidoreductase [Modestobacter marinus]CCH87015.1 Short-chain dehydrogenase/reductase SDR [Modestobacter marinus]
MSTSTALVTGAGRGIGRAVAVRLAHSGWRVYGGVRTDVAAEQLAAESDLITPVELDVTVPEHLTALDRVLPERLDALVNNAGVAVGGPVETLSRADMRTQFEVNLIGPLAVTRAVLPRLRRARGRVVFISSINGRVSFPFTGIYNASKYATEAVADCLRVELRPFGVQVGLVEPGVIDTDPWHEMDELIDGLEAGLEPEHRELYAPQFAGERRLIGRIRTNAKPPERVAAAVERQLTRRRVRPRTLVGADARLVLGMKVLLPARGLDAVWARSTSAPVRGARPRVLS